MGMFRLATNQQAFLKAGFLGFQGSGKTYTAVDLAIGLHQYVKATKPVYFVDTETGSDWAIPRFKAAGIELRVAKTRAFVDLLECMKEAEREAGILIIDSVSHFWAELMEAFRAKRNITRIEFQHWMILKADWQKFSERFVNSQLHIIVCGRAGYEYNYEVDEEGKKELLKTGTKMKAEGEFGFEPSLLVEMERARDSAHVGATVEHIGHVIKDRRMDGKGLDGMQFKNPCFKDFLPHIEALNLGGEHVGVDATRTSEEMFTATGESYGVIQSRRRSLIEEIEGVLKVHYPGATKDENLSRLAIKRHALGTYSDEQIGKLDPEQLKLGLEIVTRIAGDKAGVEKIISELTAAKPTIPPAHETGKRSPAKNSDFNEEMRQ